MNSFKLHAFLLFLVSPMHDGYAGNFRYEKSIVSQAHKKYALSEKIFSRGIPFYSSYRDCNSICRPRFLHLKLDRVYYDLGFYQFETNLDKCLDLSRFLCIYTPLTLAKEALSLVYEIPAIPYTALHYSKNKYTLKILKIIQAAYSLYFRNLSEVEKNEIRSNYKDRSREELNSSDSGSYEKLKLREAIANAILDGLQSDENNTFISTSPAWSEMKIDLDNINTSTSWKRMLDELRFSKDDDLILANLVIKADRKQYYPESWSLWLSILRQQSGPYFPDEIVQFPVMMMTDYIDENIIFIAKVFFRNNLSKIYTSLYWNVAK